MKSGRGLINYNYHEARIINGNKRSQERSANTRADDIYFNLINKTNDQESTYHIAEILPIKNSPARTNGEYTYHSPIKTIGVFDRQTTNISKIKRRITDRSRKLKTRREVNAKRISHWTEEDTALYPILNILIDDSRQLEAVSGLKEERRNQWGGKNSGLIMPEKYSQLVPNKYSGQAKSSIFGSELKRKVISYREERFKPRQIKPISRRPISARYQSQRIVSNYQRVRNRRDYSSNNYVVHGAHRNRVRYEKKSPIFNNRKARRKKGRKIMQLRPIPLSTKSKNNIREGIRDMLRSVRASWKKSNNEDMLKSSATSNNFPLRKIQLPLIIDVDIYSNHPVNIDRPLKSILKPARSSHAEPPPGEIAIESLRRRREIMNYILPILSYQKGQHN